jgi:hypothetical protein
VPAEHHDAALIVEQPGVVAGSLDTPGATKQPSIAFGDESHGRARAQQIGQGRVQVLEGGLDLIRRLLVFCTKGDHLWVNTGKKRERAVGPTGGVVGDAIHAFRGEVKLPGRVLKHFHEFLS